jgi:branched-chain amino acid transport system substrate-binding protein
MGVRPRFILVIAIAVAILSACSSGSSSSGSSSSGSSSSGSSSSGAATSGASVNLGIIAPINSSYSLPNVPVAESVAEKAINAKGGINGHPLHIYFCDDENQTAVAQQCADTLVQTDHVIAVGGTTSIVEQSIIPVLQAAGVPYLCSTPVQPQSVQSPIAFPCAAGAYIYEQVALLPSAPTWHKVVLICLQDAACDVAQAQQSFASAHLSVKVSSMLVPSTTVDWTPIATELKGYDAIISQISASENQLFIQAMKAVQAPATLVLQAGATSEADLQALAGSGIKAEMISEFQLDPSDSAYRAEMIAQFKQYASGNKDADTITGSSIVAWLFPTIVANAANSGSLKSLTPAGVLTWLHATSSLNTGGLTTPLDVAQPSCANGLPRLFNTKAIALTIDDSDGSLKSASSQFKSLIPGCTG